MLLVDTDVLIDFLKSVPEAIRYLNSLPGPPLVSAVTVAELYAGVRDNERTALDALIAAVQVVPIEGPIAVRGGLIRRDYRKSHGVSLADALIAATAEIRGATLVTLNRKHFPMLPNVSVPYRKP